MKMKIFILFALLIISCSRQDKKVSNCNILPSFVEKPILDKTKLNLNGGVNSVITMSYGIDDVRAFNYLKFDKNGFLVQKISDEPFNEDNLGVQYNKKIRLRSKGVISNYNYTMKNGIVNSFTQTDSIFKIDSNQNLIIEYVDKINHIYSYNSNDKLMNYKYHMYSTDTMAVNSETPIVEINLVYDKDKIIGALETIINSIPKKLKYEYIENKTIITEEIKDGYKKTYLNCNLQTEMFYETYSTTERLYDKNGNRLSQKIKYKDGESAHSYKEYNEMNNVIIEQRIIGPKLGYVYELDNYNNWTNKKMINVGTGEVIVESKRVITYY